MTGTFELSYYPFRDAYPDSVIEVLADLRQIEGITIETNGMSTVLIGDFQHIWTALGDIAARRLGQEDAALVLKVARGRREFID
jgi:uncharacterized protein YqgV (UPF0045/DUF77 family)